MRVQPLPTTQQESVAPRQTTISQQLAEFGAGLNYDNIPKNIRECAKFHILDVIGTALAATHFDFSEHQDGG